MQIHANLDMNQSVIDLRLNPDDIHRKLQEFITGIQIAQVWDQETQAYKYIERKIGEPRMNDKGVQSYLGWLTGILSAQTVQGNMDDIFFSNFIADLHQELNFILHCNNISWDLSLNDIDLIISATMGLLIPFFSRTIDNEERKSYVPTIRSEEKNVIHSTDSQKGGLGK